MPHSLILNLTPASPIPTGYLSGKHLHALFLTLVSSVDKSLGDRLHAQQASKAFSLSPLQRNDRPQRSHTLRWSHPKSIPAGTPCWWRVALLDDALFSHLTPLWLNLNPERPWHLGPADLHITSILGTPQSTQPWAGYSAYADLYQNASDRDRQIDFAFCTPVAFRQGGFDTSLPTRDLVFSSLLRRWNHYSDRQFPESLLTCLYPSFFDIRTELVADARSKFIGCVGAVTFRVMGEVSPEAIKQINALANFALYAGVGRKTTMGMGMVRRLQHVTST